MTKKDYQMLKISLEDKACLVAFELGAMMMFNYASGKIREQVEILDTIGDTYEYELEAVKDVAIAIGNIDDVLEDIKKEIDIMSRDDYSEPHKVSEAGSSCTPDFCKNECHMSSRGCCGIDKQLAKEHAAKEERCAECDSDYNNHGFYCNNCGEQCEGMEVCESCEKLYGSGDNFYCTFCGAVR